MNISKLGCAANHQQAQNPESRIQNPLICHLWILHAGAESSIRNMQFPRLLRDSGCCGSPLLGQDPECAPDRPTCSFHTFCGILDAAAGSRMRGAECRILENAGFSRIQGFFRIQNPGLQILFPLPHPELTVAQSGPPMRARSTRSASVQRCSCTQRATL